MFYLKCLTDAEEIDSLIKREIDERDWFVYADSQHARNSKWVTTEREYIESLTGKHVFTVDLEASPEAQLKQIEHMTRQMKVFISYSHRDIQLCQRIQQKLISQDMLVLTDEDLTPQNSWIESAHSQITDACHNGFVLLLITENTVNSRHIAIEIQKTKQEHGKIVPVYIGNATLNPDLVFSIGDIQGVHLDEHPTDDDLDKLVDNILHRVEYYSNDYTNSYGFRSAQVIHLPPISRIDKLTFWDCENVQCIYVPRSVIYISSDAFDEINDVLIKCYANSYCEQYCKKHNMKYELIED